MVRAVSVGGGAFFSEIARRGVGVDSNGERRTQEWSRRRGTRRTACRRSCALRKARPSVSSAFRRPERSQEPDRSVRKRGSLRQRIRNGTGFSPLLRIDCRRPCRSGHRLGHRPVVVDLPLGSDRVFSAWLHRRRNQRDAGSRRRQSRRIRSLLTGSDVRSGNRSWNFQPVRRRTRMTGLAGYNAKLACRQTMKD